MEQTYLDWAATAYPDRALLEQALKLSLETFANPSSPHKEGKAAAALAAAQKAAVAECFGARPEQMIFTSGGTESNNMMIFSLLKKKRKGNIIISAVEHPSIFEPAMALGKFGWEVRTVVPGPDCIIKPEKIAAAIDEDTRMVLLILLNNETGAIQPVDEIGRLIRSRSSGPGIHFHIDAVQAAGKIPLKLGKLPIDSASISSHKFQGPRGCGLLYLEKPADMLYTGGGQEAGLRHGTENTFGMVGTALAAKKSTASIDQNMEHAIALKKILIERISSIRGALIIPSICKEELLDPKRFSPYILSASFKPVPGEVMMRVLSDRGYDVGTGSACSTGKKKKSRVMDAIGVSADDAYSIIRISTGPETEIEKINQFCDTLEKESTILINSLRR